MFELLITVGTGLVGNAIWCGIPAVKRRIQARRRRKWSVVIP